MIFSSPRWYRFAVGGAVLNIIAAAITGGGVHAVAHAAAASAFAVWAMHLRARRDAVLDAESEPQAIDDGVDVPANDVGALRRELSEMHERLDFAERMLAQRPPAAAVPAPPHAPRPSEPRKP